MSTTINKPVPAALFLWISFLLSLLAIPLTAHADESQDGTQGVSMNESTVIYDATYFTQYQPVTLEDMIRSIPGGSSVLSGLRRRGGTRGFGGSDVPILIDGRRMSGKANDMSTTLARIQASQVARIELIRGTAEGLDIRNEGVIFNVILLEGTGNNSSNFAEFGLNIVKEAPLRPEILLSHNGKRGHLEYGASYQYDTRSRVHHVMEDVLAPDRSPREFRDQLRVSENFKHTVTGNVAYEFTNGTRLRLNGLYTEDDSTESRVEEQFQVANNSALIPFATEESDFRFFDKEWELGGDLELGVGSIGRLKTLFVLTRTDVQDNISQDLIGDTGRARLFTNVANADESESIIRTSMTSTIGSAHTLEYGAEAALNSLDTIFSFNNDPLENALVKEKRYEIFLTHSFAISSKINLQSALTGEFSTISQNRDGETNSRSFEFLKPRLELRYDLTGSDQIRLLAERTVSQLDLNDFVASRNIEDESIDFGNPDLRPESKWEFSAGYEKRLANDGGTIEVKFFYNAITDHIDKILIGTASSGVGNIGKAREYGVDIGASIRFGFIGIPDAVLNTTWTYTKSRVTDPFNGVVRQIRPVTPKFWEADFRHDIANSGFTYGFSVHRRSSRVRQDVSLFEITRYKRHVFSFVEYSISAKTKIRFEYNHMLRDKRSQDKTFYDGNIANNVIDRIDFQRDYLNSDLLLTLQTSF